MPKSDSTITATFVLQNTYGNEHLTVYNIIVVDPPVIEKNYSAETFIVPILILFICASAIFFTLIKVKPSSKTDALLDKIESKIPKFLRF